MRKFLFAFLFSGILLTAHAAIAGERLSFPLSAGGLTTGSIPHVTVFNPPGDSVQVFLGISHNDEAVVSAVRQALSGIAGVSVLAYCNSHAVFMLYLNTAIIRSDGDMLTQLKSMLPKQASLLSIKQGAFSDFYKYCQAADPTEALHIKNLN